MVPGYLKMTGRALLGPTFATRHVDAISKLGRKRSVTFNIIHIGEPYLRLLKRSVKNENPIMNPLVNSDKSTTKNKKAKSQPVPSILIGPSLKKFIVPNAADSPEVAIVTRLMERYMKL